MGELGVTWTLFLCNTFLVGAATPFLLHGIIVNAWLLPLLLQLRWVASRKASRGQILLATIIVSPFVQLSASNVLRDGLVYEDCKFSRAVLKERQMLTNIASSSVEMISFKPVSCLKCVC